jgi:hypothetical protein
VWRERVAAYGRLEEEFRQERAAALGRIGRTLEGHLATLQRLRAAWRDAPAPDREQLAAQYADVHRQAVRYRWYLEVQREAVGLRRHERLDEQYRVPPPAIDDPGSDPGRNPGCDPERGARVAAGGGQQWA